MKNLKQALIIILGVLSLTVACGPKNARLEPPIQTYDTQNVQVGQTKIPNPVADMIILVDNSLSMTSKQRLFIQNIDEWINGFDANPSIDWHIAVLPINDTWSANPQSGKTKTTSFPPGHFVQPKDPVTSSRGFFGRQEVPSFAELQKYFYKNTDAHIVDGPPYITRDTPDFLLTLKQTVFLGVEQGPEYEEIFSPFILALSQPLVNTVNNGFLRNDPDAHLILVTMSDADDQSPNLTPDQFLYNSLLKLKSPDKLHLIPVMIPSHVKAPVEKNGVVDESTICTRDSSGTETGKPVKIDRLIALARNLRIHTEPLNLCSPTFGKELTAIGKSLLKRIGRREILIKYPNFKELKVTFGSTADDAELVDFDKDSGWSYDPAQSKIYISENFKPKHSHPPDATFSINVQEAHLINARYKLVENFGHPLQ